MGIIPPSKQTYLQYHHTSTTTRLATCTPTMKKRTHEAAAEHEETGSIGNLGCQISPSAPGAADSVASNRAAKKKRTGEALASSSSSSSRHLERRPPNEDEAPSHSLLQQNHWASSGRQQGARRCNPVAVQQPAAHRQERSAHLGARAS